jgi:hypothetical protein
MPDLDPRRELVGGASSDGARPRGLAAAVGCRPGLLALGRGLILARLGSGCRRGRSRECRLGGGPDALLRRRGRLALSLLLSRWRCLLGGLLPGRRRGLARGLRRGYQPRGVGERRGANAGWSGGNRYRRPRRPRRRQRSALRTGCRRSWGCGGRARCRRWIRGRGGGRGAQAAGWRGGSRCRCRRRRSRCLRGLWRRSDRGLAQLRNAALELLDALRSGDCLVAQCGRLACLGEVEQYQDRQTDDGGEPGVRSHRRYEVMDGEGEWEMHRRLAVSLRGGPAAPGSRPEPSWSRSCRQRG